VFFHGMAMDGVDGNSQVLLVLWTEVSLVQHAVMAAYVLINVDMVSSL